MTDTPEVVTIDNEEFYQWKVVLRIPKNWTPESGVFIAVAPPGGIANFPAAVQGGRGFTPTFRNIAVEELAPDGPENSSAVWDIVNPGDEDTPPVWDLLLKIKTGAAGAAGTSNLLDAADLDGDAAAGLIFAVKSDGEGGYRAELVSQKVGNTYWPTTVTVLSNATGANAVAAIAIPAQTTKYRLLIQGQQEMHPDGPDVKVDLVARLGGASNLNATDGPVIARGLGLAGGADQVLAFAAAPPVASTAGFGEVAAGVAKVVYIRCEQVGSGLDTFDTVEGRALFSATVQALM